jgi:hypothetical protein
MVVYKSPFKTQYPKPTPVSDSGTSPSSSTYESTLQIKPSGNSGTSVNKTSFDDEKRKLDKSIKSVASRIKTAGDKNEYEKILAELKRVGAGGKNKTWTDNKLFGVLKNTVLDTALGPLYSASKNPVTKDIIAMPSRTVQSVVDYAFAQPASNLTNMAIAEITGNDSWKKNVEWTSFGKMLSRARDPEWSLKKEDRYKTGAKWFDTAMGFGIDVVADPLTYTGVGELQWAGRAGRSALALKFGEEAMLKKYPQMAGKLDDIVRYGTAAIPKDIRAAEGITNGIRFAGSIVPNTETVAEGLIAPVTKTRTAIGDFLYKSDKGRALQQAVAPASRKTGVVAGVGYRGKDMNVLSDERVIKNISGTSADRYAKAAGIASHGRWIAEAKPLIDAAREAGVIDDIAQLIESEVDRAAAAPEARALAESFMAWQTKVRGEVNEVYSKFGLNYGVDTKEVGFVEDYVHHKLTKEARKWVLGQGKRYAGSWFQTADLSINDLTGAIGAVRHRKLKAGDKFMGETLQTGTIKEINEISMRPDKAGVKWFETDLGSIADAYSYSMSKTMGREAWARRMMDFGPEYIKPLIKKTVPDKILQRDLGIIHGKLISAQFKLRNAVYIGGKSIAKFGSDSVELAEKVLRTQGKAVTKNAAEIKNTEKLLNDVEVALVQSYEVARTKSVAERGAYADVHKALYDLQRRLRAALNSSEDSHGAAVQVLKEHYVKLFPDARKIPDNPDRLAADILRKNKVNVAKETKHIEQRMADLSTQIDELAPTIENEETRRVLIDELNDLQDHVDGISALTMVRFNESYSPDGFVYGYVDDFGPLPEGTTNYRRLTTYPPDNNFANNPDAVAMHAPDQSTLIDLRNGEDFRMTIGNPNMPKILTESLKNARVIDYMDTDFEQQALSYFSGNDIDEVFAFKRPEQAELIKLIGDFATLPQETFDEDTLVMIFDSLDDQLRHVANNPTPAVGEEFFEVPEEFYDEIDTVAKQMMDDIIGNMIAGTNYNGMIIPSTISNGMHPDLVGKFDVLMKPEWSRSVPKTGTFISSEEPVQRVAESTLVQRILNSDYESVSLDTQQRISDVADNLMQAELTDGQIEVLAAQQRSLSAQKGAVTKRSNRTVKATEAAMAQYEKSKTINVVINGKRTALTREQGLKMMADVDKQVARQEAALEKVIAQIERDAGLPQLLKKQATYQERLPMLFNQAEVLQRWNEEVGVKLQAEIDNLNAILLQKPSKKAAGMQTGAWAKKVQASIKAIDVLGPNDGKAYARVVKQLHADEAKLAMLTYNKLPANLMEIDAVKKGFLGSPTFQYQVQKGWEAIAALGVQVPDELISQWGPNIRKLEDKEILKALDGPYRYYTRLFKTYAVASPGFAVRNAMSATFMNYVAGVETKNILEGARMSWAIQRHGENWLEKMNIPKELHASYRRAWDVTRVTSRGFGDSLAEPVVGGGFAEAVINNKFTRGFGKLNEFTERSMRLPMALDSVLRGHSFDQAVNRVTMYHFDYTDLSSLDKFMHNIVPFWIWTSRNLPLQVASQWSRPSAYATYEKLQEANPVEEDIFLPKWLSVIKPMGVTGNLVLAPDMPQARLSQTLESMNPLNAKFIGQLNPLIKVPIELAVINKQAAMDIPFNQDRVVEAKGLDAALAWVGEKTGIEPLGGRDPKTGKLMVTPKAQYFGGAVLPPIAVLQRLGQGITGGNIGGKESYKERTLSSWANWLGLPVREIGPDQQRSEAISRQFEVKEFAKILEKQDKLKKK